MNKTLIVLATSMALMAVPVHADENSYAMTAGDQGLCLLADSCAYFTIPDGADGRDAPTTVSTSTNDPDGFGLNDVDVYFQDAAGSYLEASCATGGDETCAIPEGAVTVEVAAYSGFDITGTVTFS